MSGQTCAATSEETASEHLARYEALRDQALEPQALVARYGLAALLRQGMAAWLVAWSEVPAPPQRAAGKVSPRPAPLSEGSNAEMVRILAAMTLGRLQELHT